MNSKNLRKIALKKQRSSERKMIIKSYKEIKKVLVKVAKKGKTVYDYKANTWHKDTWCNLVAFKLFKKKHKDFDVKITFWYDHNETTLIDSETFMVKIEF